MSEEIRIIILKICELSQEMANIQPQSYKYNLLQAQKEVLEEVMHRIAKGDKDE